MPTAPAYIMQTALLVPALVRLGVPVESAHLFVFYFAILSAITPPVALAVYAANGISRANLWDSSLAALRLGATGFIADARAGPAPGERVSILSARRLAHRIRRVEGRRRGHPADADHARRHRRGHDVLRQLVGLPRRAAEELMGRAIEGRRDKVFLMTKNCERDYAGSMRCLEDSLRRLRTDRIDLWQFHEIIYDNDPDWVFEKGGMKAALEARKAGKVRYIGFTGHKHPDIHLAC
jgi:hypothetical protein